MCSEESALLTAIRAHPAEDTPRLVYADWLQEHGDEARAEFIRLQCATARMPEPEVKTIGGLFASERERSKRCCIRCGAAEGDQLCEFHAARFREAEILDLRNPRADNEHVGDAWLSNEAFRMTTHGAAGPFWLYPTNSPYTRNFEAQIVRGFVDAVRCEGYSWAAHGDELLRFQPVTRVGIKYLPQIETDIRGLHLVGDPERRSFGRDEVNAERVSREECARAGEYGGVYLALLALRWPGVTFTYTRVSDLNIGSDPDDAPPSPFVVPEPAAPLAIPAPDVPRVSEIGFGAPMERDAAGLSRIRRFQVDGATSANEAVDACGLRLLDPHPTDPRFRLEGFEAKHALAIHNAWNVTVTYRPAEVVA